MVKTIISFIINLQKRMNEHHISAYAAQAAFFTILSVFPFVMFMITMIHFLPISTKDLTELLLSCMPESFEPYTKPIITETLDHPAGTMMSFSILITIWTASKGSMSLKNGLNTITGIRKNKNYIIVRLICAGYTFLFAIILCLILVLMVFGNHIIKMLITDFPIIRDISRHFGLKRLLVSGSVLILFFTLLYRALPDKKSPLLHCLPGAVFSCIGWLLVSLAFSFYIEHFNNFAVMYGSLTSILLTLLWLYFCMYIIFIGEELNQILFY